MDAGDNVTVARLKAEIAACTRILEDEKILDYSGHVSACLPDRSGFLIQSVHASRAELAPGDLYTLSMDGDILDGPADTRPVSEFHIHSEIYKARDDVNAVLHAHPDIATLFTIARGAKLVMVKNHGYRWRRGVPTHADSAHINTPQLGRELVATMGACNASLIRAHGIVLVAESIPHLLIDGVHFEDNAQALLNSAPLGPPIPVTEEELDIFEQRFDRENHAVKLWKYYVGRGLKSAVLDGDWNGLLQ